MTVEPLSDEARAKIERYADRNGSELPPIPHLDLDPVGTPNEVRDRIEKHAGNVK